MPFVGVGKKTVTISFPEIHINISFFASKLLHHSSGGGNEKIKYPCVFVGQG